MCLRIHNIVLIYILSSLCYQSKMEKTVCWLLGIRDRTSQPSALDEVSNAVPSAKWTAFEVLRRGTAMRTEGRKLPQGSRG